jgi:hypothetical protein
MVYTQSITPNVQPAKTAVFCRIGQKEKKTLEIK